MLKKIIPKSLDVLSAFLERKKALPIYDEIINSISGNTIYKKINSTKKNKGYLYCIYDFPSYLKGQVSNNEWKSKIINTYKGSLILLKNHNNVDAYLKNKFRAGRRSKFRTYQKRLETCFNIEYKSYFGEISKDEYEYLFKEFHKMIQNRFLEKKIQNYDLSRWDIYYEIAYPLINSKEAVLFAIFSERKPISICLNLVRDKTIYGYIRTYDIDYSKFYIGFTDFIKQLHWCYENDIEIFDLLKGNYPYKARLIDSQYDFQKHVVYNSNSLLTSISANIIIARTRAFYFLVKVLKKININVVYHKFLKYKYRNRELSKIEDTSKKTIINNNVKIESEDQLLKVNLNDDALSFLKRPVYNFLYSNQESLQNVEIFNLQNELNTYIIKGMVKMQKITFK